MVWLSTRSLGVVTNVTIAAILVLAWPWLRRQTFLSISKSLVWLLTLPARHWRVTLGICVAFVAFFVWGPYLLAYYAADLSVGSQYWWGVISGNWNPTGYPPLIDPAQSAIRSLEISDRIWFYLSAIVAVLLNNAILFIIIATIWKFLKEREAKMNIAQAMTLITAHEKAKVLRVIKDSETKEAVSQAFNEAESTQEAFIAKILGENAARQVMQAMRREISGLDL